MHSISLILFSTWRSVVASKTGIQTSMHDPTHTGIALNAKTLRQLELIGTGLFFKLLEQLNSQET